MRKQLPKIIIILLIVVGAVLLSIHYIFFGPAPKSKAAGETIWYIFDPASVNQTVPGDFTTSVKIKPSVDMTIRGYQFDIIFDNNSDKKIQFKSIQYNLGTVSAGLGDDDSKASVINRNGKIKVAGEIQSATGQLISSTENTAVVTITFSANPSQLTSINTGLTDAQFFWIKPDYSLFGILSAGTASFHINPVEPTMTPTPTSGPTSTPVPGEPTSTPVPPTATLVPPTVTPIPPTETPIPPTATPAPGCDCDASSNCTSVCPVNQAANQFSDVTYANPIKCSRETSIVGPTPDAAGEVAYCQRPYRVKGDANGDGVVDQNDYAIYLRAVLGAPIASSANPDFNGDGTVSPTDLAIWKHTR